MGVAVAEMEWEMNTSDNPHSVVVVGGGMESEGKGRLE